MVIKQLSHTTLQQLQQLLEQMNIFAQELEAVGQQEVEAIRNLNSGQVMQLTDRRIAAHQQLALLEKQCRTLLAEQGIAQEMTLEMVINTYTGERTADFQALRRNLYERMLRVDKSSQENRMRLLAAYNVSTSILQELGLVNREQTYNRRTAG